MAKQYDNSQISAVASSGWATVASMNVARREAAAVKMADGRVLVAGGTSANASDGTGALKSAEIYDPVADTWTSIPDMAANHYLAGIWLLPNNKILVAGGLSGASTVTLVSEEYNPASNTWATVGAQSTDHSNGYWVTLADGSPMSIGGWVSTASATAVTEIYNYNTQTWSNSGSLNTARRLHTASLLTNGKVLVAAGRNASNVSIASCELWDPATGLWTNTGSLSQSRRSAAQTSLSDGGAIVGGGSKDPSTGLTSVERYSVTTGLWTSAGDLNAGTTVGKTLRHIPYFQTLANGLIVGGGGLSSAGSESRTDIYDVTSNTWVTGCPLNQQRHFAPHILLNDNRILIIGGQDNPSATILSSCEAYTDDSTNITTGLIRTTALQPNLVIPEFTADPGASGRIWSYQRSTAGQVRIGFPGGDFGGGIGATVNIDSFAWHSILD